MKSKKSQPPVFFLRKVASSLALASTFVLSSAISLSPTFAISEKPVIRESGLSEINIDAPLLAQARETWLLYQTDEYTVRVYRQNGQTLMNVFDNARGLLRLNGQPATFSILNGTGVFISTGDYSGRQVRYVSEVFEKEPNGFARLLIIEGTDNIITIEDATLMEIFNVPSDLLQQVGKNTILKFETSTYAVRVFSRDGQRFMNVFNKFTGETVVNGKPASLAPARPPFEDAVSYVASGTQSGQSVEYVARITGTGSTMLDIYNVNGQRLFQEPGIGEVVVNIPSSDLPEGISDIEGVSDAYVAAVFGGQETLAAVRRLFPEAFMDSARQGDFINVGSFPNREAAMVRVLQLQSEGFNARLIYRDIIYR